MIINSPRKVSFRLLVFYCQSNVLAEDIAPLRVSVIILEMQEERTKDFPRTFVLGVGWAVGWALELLSEPP